MLASSAQRTTTVLRSRGFRSIHSSVPRSADVKSAAEGASKQLSNLAERAKAVSKPLAERASSATGGMW